MMFESSDWKAFLNADTIGRMAGASGRDLIPLIFKELGDNALDATGSCRYGWIRDPVNPECCPLGGFVEDDGSGIPGRSAAKIADYFSVSRKLRSSKKIRLPTRGALGNGLRVVSGAVHVLGGYLVVESSGFKMRIDVDERDGIARPVEPVQVSQRKGTRIEFHVDLSAGRYHEFDTRWIDQAVRMATGTYYKGMTSPHWYDRDSFFDLATSAPKEASVRQFIEQFDGCTGRKAAEISEPFKTGAGYRLIRDLTKIEAGQLLTRARAAAVSVKHARLGLAGPDAMGEEFYYSKSEGTFTPSSCANPAEIPFVVEAWAQVTQHDASAIMYVNRTPVCQSLSVGWRSNGNKNDDKYLTLAGLGLSTDMTVSVISGIKKPVRLHINICTPYCPITSTGKSPDLHFMKSAIRDAIESASRKAIKAEPKEEHKKDDSDTFKDFVYENIPAAAEHTGGGLPFKLRNLFYTVRHNWEKTGDERELKWGNFQKIVTEYENEFGFIPLMTRDNRGSIYHPHEGTEIPLGTTSVNNYTRPKWVFNKMLFIEKEGYFEAMKMIKWPEKNDCSLISSKGNATRAIKDIIDQIAETGEPVTVYAVHDADGYGTDIYEKMQEATKARPARKIKIVNCGLEPWTAEEMGLSWEKIEVKNGEKKKRVPVAEYVREYDREHGTRYEEKLQNFRIEINQLTVPAFLQYVDNQIAKHGNAGKVIPPDEVLQSHVDDQIDELIHDKALEQLREEIEAKEKELKDQVAAIDIKKIRDLVVDHLKESPALSWKNAVDKCAYDLLDEEPENNPPGPDPAMMVEESA